MAKQKDRCVSIYFPIPRSAAKKLETLRAEDDRSANVFIRRLIESRVEDFKKTKRPIPICEGTRDKDEDNRFIRLPASLVKEVDTIAGTYDRTRTRMIRHIVVAEINERA